jgi:transposase
MSKRLRVPRSQHTMIGPLEIVNPNAAGIDAGAEEHHVSVPEDRCDKPVRKFATFTADLKALVDWLVECRITTVAIEATGVYWVPLYEMLEERGLNPKLIDSRSISRKYKKTDVVDCQRIRQLHAHGLLDGAFRPPAAMLPLRAFTRQRKMLIEYAADHIRHIQKALDLMNVKLHLVVSDTVGVTGCASSTRSSTEKHDPVTLAALREPGCKASEQEFVKALTGELVMQWNDQTKQQTRQKEKDGKWRRVPKDQNEPEIE